jgi:hypothetical protein
VINSFKGFLVEEEKTVYFTFGRMNPPTIGHEKLLNVLASKASKNPYRVFVSQSQDKKKNPLGYKEKVKVIRKMFPKYARNIMLNTSVKTAMDAASALYNEGYKNVVMVVGSDRMREFETLLTKYNGTKGRHGFYNFNRISVISAGERDPDAEGVEGMSASKMRDAASAGDFTKFSQGVPSTLNNADTKAIYNAVRKGMGLKESKEFTKHVQLESVSEIRESYINGKLFKEGDTVVIKETGELGKVKTLGSNYVIIEGFGNQYRKWLDAVEKVEEPKVDYDVADFSVKLESLSEATAQDIDILMEKWVSPKPHEEHDEVHTQRQVPKGTYPDHVHKMLDHLSDKNNYKNAMSTAKTMKINPIKAKTISNTDAGRKPTNTTFEKEKANRVKKQMASGKPMQKPIVLHDTHSGHTHLLAGNTRLTMNTHHGSKITPVHAITYDSSKLKESTTRQDKDIADRKGTQPARYHTGLAKSTKAARDAQFKRQAKMSDKNPSAYQPAPGDKDSKTKPSKYTMKFKDMYKEAVSYHGNPNKDDDERNAARRKRLAKDNRNSYTGDNFYAKPKNEQSMDQLDKRQSIQKDRLQLRQKNAQKNMDARHNRQDLNLRIRNIRRRAAK